MENIVLYNKIALLPEQMKEEAGLFLDFLMAKAKIENKLTEKPTAKFGSGKGMFVIPPDFDEPLEDFKDYM